MNNSRRTGHGIPSFAGTHDGGWRGSAPRMSGRNETVATRPAPSTHVAGTLVASLPRESSSVATVGRGRFRARVADARVTESDRVRRRSPSWAALRPRLEQSRISRAAPADRWRSVAAFASCPHDPGGPGRRRVQPQFDQARAHQLCRDRLPRLKNHNSNAWPGCQPCTPATALDAQSLLTGQVGDQDRGRPRGRRHRWARPRPDRLCQVSVAAGLTSASKRQTEMTPPGALHREYGARLSAQGQRCQQAGAESPQPDTVRLFRADGEMPFERSGSVEFRIRGSEGCVDGVLFPLPTRKPGRPRPHEHVPS